jgi:hypothetical protein
MIVLKAYFLEGKVTFHKSSLVDAVLSLVDVGYLAAKDRVPVRH